MTEREIAERFSNDCDELLAQREPSDHEGLPTDYAATLDIARALTKRDFSAQSQQRLRLRQQLLTGALGQAAVVSRKRGFWNHPLVSMPLAVATLMLFCILTIPSLQPWRALTHSYTAPVVQTPISAAQTALSSLSSQSQAAPQVVPTLAVSATPMMPTATQAAQMPFMPAQLLVLPDAP
jgi:hypothetical protein